MPNHTYKPGDRVECISTGDIARFIADYTEDRGTISVKIADVQPHGVSNTRAEWPASDCRHAVTDISLMLDMVAKVRSECDICTELAAKDAEIARLEAENEALRCHHSDADRALSEWHKQAQRIAEIEAQVAKLEARNERMTQYVDDACECCRCCECQGWNPECSILATKRHKGIDIVTGEQLRAAAEMESL